MPICWLSSRNKKHAVRLERAGCWGGCCPPRKLSPMMFTKRLRDRVRCGDITLSVRIWKSPRVKVGGRYPMEEGQIEIDSIDPIGFPDITPELARASGFLGVLDLLKVAKHGSGEKIYLVRFHYIPPAKRKSPKPPAIREKTSSSRTTLNGVKGSRKDLLLYSVDSLTDLVCSRPALTTNPQPELLQSRAQPRPSDLAAILLAISGFTCWVFADSIMKIVGRSALPAYQVIGFSASSSPVFSSLYTLARRDTSSLWPQRPRRQLSAPASTSSTISALSLPCVTCRSRSFTSSSSCPRRHHHSRRHLPS